MSLVFDLPRDVHNDICSEWLVVSDLSRLDCAMSNKRLRGVFLHQLKSKSLIIKTVYRSINFLQWIDARRIRLTTLCLNPQQFNDEGIFCGPVAFEYLQELKIIHLNLNHIKAVNIILACTKNLTSLECGPADFDLKFMKWPVQLLQKLQCLKIEWTQTPIELIRILADRCQYLQYVDLITDSKGFDCFTKNFSGQLRCVKFNVNALTLKSVFKLILKCNLSSCKVEVIQRFPGVVVQYSCRHGYSYLSLTSDRCIEGVSEFLKLLQGFNALHEIHIENVEENDANYLCLNTLVKVRLGKFCRLSCTSLVYMLDNCNNLTHLEMSVSGTSDDIILLFTQNSTYLLQYLKLRCQDYSILSLISLLDKCTAIIELHVHANVFKIDEPSDTESIGEYLVQQSWTNRHINCILYRMKVKMFQFKEGHAVKDLMLNRDNTQNCVTGENPFTPYIEFSYPNSNVIW